MPECVVITPIYKPSLTADELVSVRSVSTKIAQRYGFSHTFIYPDTLDLQFYRFNFDGATFLGVDGGHLSSHASYNKLMYEADFYRLFESSEFILISQADAYVIDSSAFEQWIHKGYDFVGAPDSTRTEYDLSQTHPFNKLPFLDPVFKARGINGGFSLRRTKKFIRALEDFPELTKLFKCHGDVGVGEDFFFSNYAAFGRERFSIPSPLAASDFCLTDSFDRWVELKGGDAPIAIHGWYRAPVEAEFLRRHFGIPLD